MKTNAITRIIIWSIILVLLICLLGVGLYRPGRRLSEKPVATEVLVPADSASVMPSEEPQQYRQATVIATAVNIRTAPNSDSTPLGMLKKNETVTITRQENVNGERWAYITQPGTGWVKAEYLSTEPIAPSASNEQLSLDPRQIREIDIEWAAGTITIEPAEVDTILVSEAASGENKYAMVWKQTNDKLTIRFSENLSLDLGFGISINDVVSKDLTILVPMGWECDSLDVDAASAIVDIKNLSIREVDFDGASGTCNFANCVVDKLDLDTASGDIYYTGTLNLLDCDAASASVYAVFDNVPSRIEMDSMSGDLDITLPSDAGFSVSMDALSSDFVSDFSYTERSGNYHHGDGKCKISLNALSGDLYIRECKESDAIPAGHHHTDECTTNPDSCPDNLTHHTESHHK